MVGMPAILAAFIASAIGGVPTFDAPIEIQFPNAQYPTQPAVADFDRDGQLDLVVPGRNTTGLVAIVLRRPDGSFDASRTISIGVQTDWAEAADFDGDGLQDIALGVRATFGAVAIVRGHGDGTFDPAILFATERETRCVRVGDMNHDGRPDFVAVNYGSHSIQVFHNASTPGNINFILVQETRLNRWTIGLAYPSWATLVDFNHDGFLDIIDFTAGSSRVSSRVASGSGLGRERAWSAPVVNNSGSGITLGAVADLDRDGNPDAIAHLIVSDRTNPIAVWRGNLGSGFDPYQMFAGATAGIAWNVATADMDNDGDQDVITLSVFPGQVCIIENKTTLGGALNLGAPVQILTGDFPRHVCALDFDHDGKQDLAVVDLTKHKLILLRNAGVQAGISSIGAAPDSAIAQTPAEPSHELLNALAHTTRTNGNANARGKFTWDVDSEIAMQEVAIALGNIGPALPNGFAPVPQMTDASNPISLVATCGPPAGDCLVIHNDPFCYTTPCCEIVCAFDSNCCETTWDVNCVDIAKTDCRGIVCPSRGSCTQPHAGGGCEDATCCERVGRLDPSCIYNWDALCVELVAYVCIDSAPTVSIPPEAIDEDEHCYQHLSEGCGRRTAPLHVPIFYGQIRKGVITGDGSRDVDAHVLVLDERKSISLQLHAEFPAQLVLSQGACEGPLVTYQESLAAAGEPCVLERVLDAGEWRITVGMATPSQTLRNGQPCGEENPDYPWGDDPPPTPGFFGIHWWMSISATDPPLAGDLDGSGNVDSGDIGMLMLLIGDIESEFDFDGSGQVDSGDVGYILLNFN